MQVVVGNMDTLRTVGFPYPPIVNPSWACANRTLDTEHSRRIRFMFDFPDQSQNHY
jgi:hypothetical protein